MQKISHYIRNLSFFYAFSILATALGSVYFLVWLIYHKLLGTRYDIIFVENPHSFHQTYWGLVFGAIVIASLLETVIFQVGGYHLLKKIKCLQKRKCYIVLIGGILFGLFHFFSLSYIIVTTITGTFFMYAYIIKRHKGGYWLVVLLHAFVNGLALFLEHFE